MRIRLRAANLQRDVTISQIVTFFFTALNTNFTVEIFQGMYASPVVRKQLRKEMLPFYKSDRCVHEIIYKRG